MYRIFIVFIMVIFLQGCASSDARDIKKIEGAFGIKLGELLDANIVLKVKDGVRYPATKKYLVNPPIPHERFKFYEIETTEQGVIFSISATGANPHKFDRDGFAGSLGDLYANNKQDKKFTEGVNGKPDILQLTISGENRFISYQQMRMTKTTVWSIGYIDYKIPLGQRSKESLRVDQF